MTLPSASRGKRTVPLKYACCINNDVLPESTDPNFEFEYIDIGGVSLEQGIISRELIKFENAPSRARKRVQDGDVIVSTVRTYLKAIANINKRDHQSIVSTGFAVLRPQVGVNPRYLYRLCQSESFIAEVRALSTGVSYPAINPSALASIKIPLPDMNRQAVIADSIEREVSRIDRLILLKKQQLKLINTHYMTSVQTYIDNQISFLQPPSVAIRRFIVSMCDGPFGSALKSEHYSSDGIRVIRLQNIGRGHFINASAAYISEEYYSTLGNHDVNPGDLLVASLGDTGNPVGRACIAPGNIGRSMVKADCFRLRLDENIILNKFLALYLSSPMGVKESSRESKGVTRDRINLSILAGMRIPLLSIDVQKDILRKALIAEDRASKATCAIERSIDLLKKRRSTFIETAIAGETDAADIGLNLQAEHIERVTL